MKQRSLQPLASAGLVLLLLVGCSGTTATDTPVVLPSTTTPSPSPTVTHTPLPTATLSLPLTVGTAMPQLSNVISIENATSIVEIASWIGHTSGIYSVTFSPDGSILASTSFDNTVRLWDVASGSQLRTLEFAGVAWNSAFSPDGETLALRSDDRTVILFDVASGRELRRLAGDPETGRIVAFSPDGSRVAATSFDSTVRLWDAVSGNKMSSLSGHTDGLGDVEFSPDGMSLGTASGDGTVKLWDVTSGSVLRTLQVGNQAWEVTFSPDASMLAVITARPDGTPEFPSTLTLWNVANGSKLSTVSTDPDTPRNMVFSPDGKLLVAHLNDGTLVFYDVASSSELHRLSDHSDTNILGLAFSPDGKLIASTSGHDNPAIRIWGIHP